MADELLKTGILRRKTPEDLKGILGNPMRVYEDSLGSRWGYCLGVRNRAFYTDPEFLIVQIRKGLVTDYYLKPCVPYTQ
jgi:hypothetical protein